jgi:hypothetical protein
VTCIRLSLLSFLLCQFCFNDTTVTFKVLFWVFLQSLILMLDNCTKIPPAYGNKDVRSLWLHNRSFRFHIKVLGCNVFYLHITRNLVSTNQVHPHICARILGNCPEHILLHCAPNCQLALEGNHATVKLLQISISWYHGILELAFICPHSML